jgi:four helix bundle protein
MKLFKLSKSFPAEEKYSLTDQMRRSSRSIAANIAEGWRKRRYQASFVSKLNDSEGEAAESQVWLQFAVESGYLQAEATRPLYQELDDIIAMLVNMQNHPEPSRTVVSHEKALTLAGNLPLSPLLIV